MFTYCRSCPVEADSPSNDPLVRGKGCKQKETFCGGVADTNSNSLKEVMDTQRKYNEEPASSCLNTLFNRNLNLVMTVTMASLQIANG